MNYATAGAFRTALETRLRSLTGTEQPNQVRLRKLVTFDRFLARLLADQPGDWVLKGGFALELRLPLRARTTKDIDLLLVSRDADVHGLLVRAAGRPMEDWFDFEVERPQDAGRGEGAAMRFLVRDYLDGRTFDEFHIDVGQGDPIVEPADLLFTTGPLAFAGLPPTQVPCYPLSQQLAEKLHAWAEAHASGSSSRVKDLVDMLLIGSLSSFEAEALRNALRATFAHRGGSAIPKQLPQAPPGWRVPYARLARDLGLHQRDLAEAVEAVSAFMCPVLEGTMEGIWNPETWTWQSLQL